MGSVLLNSSGRKHNVYADYQPRHLLHDVMMTKQIVPVWKYTIRQKLDEHLKPDAEIRINDLVIYCEMDMGTEDIERDVVPQMKKYEDADVYNVWFAKRERLEELMKVRAKRSMFSECGSYLWFDGVGDEMQIGSLTLTPST